MFSFYLFVLSGTILAALTFAKRIELKKRKTFFLLRAISRGDERARRLYHEGLRLYSEGKHRFVFLIRKQLPLRARSYLNKTIAFLKEKGEERFGNIRNSRLIKKPDGISEFFKNISEIEKGNGELHDELPAEPAAPEGPFAIRITPVKPVIAKPSRKRVMSRRKVQIIEIGE